MAPRSPAAPRPHVGVATMTPAAFVLDGTVYLERLNLLSEDGAGVLSPALPAVGTKVPLVFRLSTTKLPVRCLGEVLAQVPTTPAGLALRSTAGEGALLAAISAASAGDSATMMFRVSDLEAAHAARAKPAPPPPRAQAVQGFCVRFLELDAAGREAVAHHVSTSLHMSETLAVRGQGLVPVVEDERGSLATPFGDGDLARRARDW